MILVTTTFRKRANRSQEPIHYREEGWKIYFTLRFSALLLWLSVLAYLLLPSALAFASLSISSLVRWSGFAGALVAAVLMLWTLRSLGKNLTDTVVTRANSSLVTQGPYRWVRHPYYVSAAIAMGAVTLLTANALIGVLSLFLFVMLAIRTPKEEQMLLEKFGEEYREYKKKVGMFFPVKPRSFSD